MGSGDADRQQAGRGALPAFAKSWEGRESGRRFVCCVSSQSVPRLRYDGRAVTPLCAWLLSLLKSIVAVRGIGCIRDGWDLVRVFVLGLSVLREGSEATAL
jgi:hypothetical protein